ncbi:serine/threonine-protein phosphatase 6 regulatory ankyrin repeat subunit B-like [Saccostrea cucullata]|uniref:serine/threonine-protein phosphatase 6 regulatory ankyrin repeat subunit B-like n=1 Tax=Saccostrea cuccullata TaxID=36930 RepID=UPI002ED30DB7
MAMRDSFDARDDSMLVHFSKAGNAKMVAFLLHNSPEKEIYKSLNKACSYNHVDVVDMLLKTGVVYDLKTCFYAVQSGNAEMLFRFTENVDVYQTEFSNHPNHLFLKVSLLHEICLLGQNQLINRVIEHYPSVLDVQNSQGGNALHFVAYAGQKDAFITLIQNGSDPYSRSHHGSTVLHYACQNGKLDLVKYICDKYPDLLTEEFDDYHGRSSLHWAAQSGNIELYKYLLKKDASLSIMFCQDNPIGMACLNGKLEMCKYLVKYHSKLFECKMRNGYKVLHQAAWAGNVDIFKCMFHEVLDIECKTDSGKTVLHMCCMNGKVDMCKYLLANYPDLVKIIDNDGWTVLLQAAWGGNIEIFELLIKEGLDVNSTTNQGETVLHLCCLSGKYKMCTYLVNKHPDLVKKNDFRGFNVLHSAAWGGNINIFKNLMERGLDVKGTSNYGHTAVHESSMNGNFQLCKYLVKNYLELVEVIDNNGESVLHKAAFAGNVDIFKLLVDKRLDITSTTNEGKTVLHLCCMNGNLQMCKYLASNYPCVVNIIDNDGMTALHCAAFGGNVEIFKFLNQKRLDAENTSDQGKTVVHWCCRKGTLGMCKYLVNNYQHLFEFKDNDGLTVLHDAAWGGDVGIFRFLISNGLDVNSKTNAGKTVLHYCCRNGKLELCRYLVQIHPELVKCMDSDGRNLLHDAAWGGNVDIFKFLIQIGLDVEITTYIGKTVMHESCLNGKRELFKHLVNNYSGLLKINDNKGESVLHDAAWGGNIDILKLLIEKGLEVKSTTDVGETVLHRCCRNGQSQMCSFLVKNYPYLIKIDDIEGKNVLHDAAFGGNIYVLKLLLSKGLDIKSTTAVGKTVLHQCCMSNNFQMCKYLVNAHPELVSISDNDGKNVLHDAARGGNVDVFRFLKEKNLDVKKTTNKGKTALHYCCKNGKLQMCRYLINDQPDLVQIVDSSGINVLHETARGGNVKILKFLLDKGIDVKNTSFTGKTILHFCCKKGQKEMLKYVISKYPSLVKSIDNDGCNLLHDAACGGNIDIFKLLIKHNLDVKSKTNKGKTVLHLCCKNGWIGLCLYLVENYHCLIKLSDNKGKTALHDAAWGGNIDVFKVLTKQNIDVTNTTNTGKTILHFCCMNGKLQMCKFLVKNYPFLIEKIDNDGETLLHSSAWGGNVYLFKFLIGKGLNVNSKTKEGKTVLHMCCMNGKVQMCKYIVENHPDLVRISDYGRKTVLHEAAWGGNIKVFKLLIDEGLDVYDKTNKGKTVLHKCCINGKVQICEYLVSHQPQLLTVQDNDGLNALHDTAIGGNVELFKFLLEKGLDVHSKTGSGQTVLHLCCHVGCHVDKQAMFDYLIESYPDLLYVVDNECNTVLHVACAQNQTKICSSLVDKFPDLLNIKNKNGEKVVVCLVEGKRQFKMKKRTLGTNFFRKFLLQ